MPGKQSPKLNKNIRSEIAAEDTIKRFGLDESISFLLRRVLGHMSRDLQKRLDLYDVSKAQWLILLSLWSKKASTPAELSEHMLIDPSTITRTLDKLEKRGLILRSISKADRRSIKVSITAKGNELIPRLSEASQSMNRLFLAPLTEAEQQNIVSILHKMLSVKEDFDDASQSKKRNISVDI
jgi:DNA-binding MarR family transcriptional regulator